MTSYPQASTPHWESRNGYTPPPRFQQLRARDSQQLLYQNQYQQPYPNHQQQQLPNQVLTPPVQGGSPEQPPDMSHTRSSSFFGFNRNKQQNSSQPNIQQRNLSPNSQLPLSTNSVPSPSAPPMHAPLSPLPQDTSFSMVQQPNSMPLQQQQYNQPLPAPPLAQQQPQRPQPQPYQPTGQNQNAGRPSTSSQQSATVTRSPSIQGNGSASATQAPPPLHPEIRSVVQLTIAHAHKIYFSGPLVRRLERQADGQKPHKDDGWTEVWAQLGGTILSVWDMKEIQEASKQGKEVPPSYINVTDAVSCCGCNTPRFLTN